MSTSVASHMIPRSVDSPFLGPHTKTYEPKKILTIFGTRPEIIKLAPLIRELEQRRGVFQTVNVTPSQHSDIVYPFVRLFEIRVDYDLRVMKPQQSIAGVCSRILSRLHLVLYREKPDLVIVQGDTISAFAGALAAFYQQIPIAHVEAGLRSRCDSSPFPEEMNRKLITRLASYHFAGTPGNRDTLLAEGVASERIFVTGNPVIDALQQVTAVRTCGERLKKALNATHGSRRIVLTTHRRESLGRIMSQNLIAIRDFLDQHADVTLIFPVHPNPQVVRAANQVLGAHPRILMTAPFDYADFIRLLSESWLIVSDSGGVQEEAPSLGKPLLIIRDNTERPEVIEAGFARLVGGSPKVLTAMLEEVYQEGSWVDRLIKTENPFGRGDASKRIVDALVDLMVETSTRLHPRE